MESIVHYRSARFVVPVIAANSVRKARARQAKQQEGFGQWVRAAIRGAQKKKLGTSNSNEKSWRNGEKVIGRRWSWVPSSGAGALVDEDFASAAAPWARCAGRRFARPTVFKLFMNSLNRFWCVWACRASYLVFTF
jgi:hypothetical protein